MRENQDHMPYEQGISIDVFPIDNIPENYALRLIDTLHCFCIRKFFWSEVGRIDEKSCKTYRIQINEPCSKRKILHHYERLIQKRNRETHQKSEWYSCHCL